MTNQKNSQSKAAQRERYANAAERYLERRGYETLERGWACRAGKVDLIVTDEDYLVFVEVKGRKGAENGFPTEAVDAKKREKLERIAAMYLRDYQLDEMGVRFDTVFIIDLGNGSALLRHHVNCLA